MRAFIFTLLLFVGCLGFSQINTPRFSPASEIEQMVGLTEIEIEYSRPSMRAVSYTHLTLPTIYSV